MMSVNDYRCPRRHHDGVWLGPLWSHSQSSTRNVAAALVLFFAAAAVVEAIPIADSADAVCNATTLSKNHPFVRVENDLFNPKYGITELSFPFRVFDDNSMQDQVPVTMSVPEFVRVFEFGAGNNNHDETTLFELGMSARRVLDANMPPSQAVLFRNLNQRITNAPEFTEFWNGVMHSSLPEGKWKYMAHDPGHCDKRPKVHGVDTPTNIAPDVLLRMHNEMVYQPYPATRIAFYCLQNATSGGESMIGLNTELTKHLPPNIKAWIKASGGFLYQRHHHNADLDSPHHFCLSWQWQTGATTPQEAKRHYLETGWGEENIALNENGDVTLSLEHSGYIRYNESDGEDVWFNQLASLPEPMRNGSMMPRELLQYAELAMWKSIRPLPLLPGDWLVLDNLKVMHGRYPLKNSPDFEKQRNILVVYAANEKHRAYAKVVFD